MTSNTSMQGAMENGRQRELFREWSRETGGQADCFEALTKLVPTRTLLCGCHNQS